MTYPNINTLTDIFIPDGYGGFGYGSGEYGGGTELLNPQWDTNSGSFGIDPLVNLPYIEATSTPSYVGAANYNMERTSFFAKIVPATYGNGSIQTAIIVKQNAFNYVEMSVGPGGVFNAYVVNNRNIVGSSSVFPTYDPTAHAYWRIRNDDKVLFHFDVSPDGSTWTELGSAPYLWDASQVTVTIFAGFTGSETAGNRAYVSHINLPGNSLQLSSIGRATASASGSLALTSQNALSGGAVGRAVFRGRFSVSLGLPEGGVTDFSTSGNSLDAAMTTNYIYANQVFITGPGGGGTFTQPMWRRANTALTAPTQYRDGSYWAPSAYAAIDFLATNSVDNGGIFMSNAMVNETPGFNNKLSLDASIYATTCCYGPSASVTNVVRTTAATLTGSYSGQVTSGTLVTIPAGQHVYYPLPLSTALVPVKYNGTGSVAESIIGTVAISTTRANTNWFASLIYYDANFNILTSSTFDNFAINNMNVHPGGGAWQTGNVTDYLSGTGSTAAYVAVVPVVVGPGSGTETIFMTAHTVVGASPAITAIAPAYTSPRNATVNVKADRVNYVTNAGFNASIAGWSQVNTNVTGTPSPVTLSWDSGRGFQSLGCMKLGFAAPSGSFSGGGTSQLGTASRLEFNGNGNFPIIQGLKPGHTYTLSAWIQQSRSCPDVFMNFYDANFVGVTSISTNAVKATNTVNGWTRISTTYTVPPTGLADYSMYFYVKYSDYLLHPTFSFWVDSILLEESDSLGDFFDGGFSSTDYQWESGGLANLSRSYYYKNYSNKLTRLNKAISSVLPVGETYSLLFSQPIT